jgi:uncharacterized protein (TIGR00288 family)
LNGSDRLKIAVFIDFDNIEIGVKSTLNRPFDVGTVLEAIKERGEVVTKVAYGDWKRAGDHSRSMSQHAIQMVQRNLTPGGDKNGADINLALDALEMAFTRNHINAFVIVGGDSDFMALVEKLKQYDKKVMVVGGRAFTSIILQKNCHEFIAYENLIKVAPQQVSNSRRPAERSRSAAPGGGDANLSKALPLVQRALKVLADREVSPQLGLLKSTLLQLDSTFTERDYNASTFRDFIEKMAAAGYVNLKQVDRSLLVELKDAEGAVVATGPVSLAGPAVVAEPSASARRDSPEGPESMEEEDPPQPSSDPSARRHAPQHAGPAPLPPPQSPASPAQIEEGVRALFEVFQNAKVAPHWPMYLRNVKQYIKNAAPSFDERRHGFVNFLEAVRACGRAGLFRLERNRQGILRIFAGSQFPQQTSAPAQSGFQEKPPIFDIENELAEAAATVDEQLPVSEGEPEAASETPEEQPITEEVAVPVRRRRPAARTAGASTPTKKRAAAPRKTKKKAADSDEEELPS